MRERRRLRGQLLRTQLGLLLGSFSALTLLAGQQIGVATRQDYFQRLVLEAQVMAEALAPSIAAYCQGTSPPSDLEAALSAYEAQKGGQLALFFTGRESLIQGSALCRDNHRDTPELTSAIAGKPAVYERRAPDGQARFYTAVSVRYRDDPLGLLAWSVEADTLTEQIRGRWLYLGLGLALMTCLSVGVTLRLAQSITAPLQHLRQAAQRLGEGDLSQRAHVRAQNELGELAQSFNDMARRLENLVQEQRAFVSHASHELRTPLTTIQLRAETLAHRPDLPPALAQQYLLEIESEAARLGSLVQSLLLLARLEAGRLERGQEHIDLVRYAQTLRQSFAPHFAEKQLTFTLNSPQTPLYAHISLNHLNVIFRNLIENAFKYTPEGGSLVWEIQPVAGGVWHRLSDSGQGLSAEQLSHVFERFYRADKARSRAGGVGLGLSLVRSLVLAYGGQIELTSAGLGQGTTVHVFLPLPPDSNL